MLVAILSTLLVVVAIEMAVRQWIMSPSLTIADARYGWVRPPHVQVVHSIEGWSRSKTNSMGLLDDELREPRARIRAVLIGDSYAEAVQVARDKDFSSVAERLLPGLEVINAGYSGRSPMEYADWIEEYGPQLQPDVVIVQLNDGDLADLLKPARAARRAALQSGGKPASTQAGFLTRLSRWPRGKSALLAAANHKVRLLLAKRSESASKPFRRSSGRGDPASRPAPFADPRVPALMDSLNARIVAHSSRLIYLYLPKIEYFGPRFDYLEPRSAAFYHEFAARNGVTLVDVYDALRAEFERTGQPLQGFANSPMGTGHMNAAGHRVVGAELARVIAETVP